MPTPNAYENFLLLQGTIQLNMLLESRLIPDENGKVLYIAETFVPKAPKNEKVWNIKKIEYNGDGYTSWVRLPDDGAGYKYTFDDIIDQFS